jgi:DNA polymerase-1
LSQVALYAEKKLTPQTWDILKELFALHPEITEVYVYNEFLDRSIPVLVLGHLPDVLPLRYRRTLSQAQIAATPSSVTELNAALNLLFNPFEWEPFTYEVVDYLNLQQLGSLGRELVVDIETGGDFNVLLPHETWLISVAIYDGTHCYVFTEESLQTEATRRQLYDLLTAKNRRLIAHNGKFDFRILSIQLGLGVIYGNFDTLLAHHALNHGAKEHGLKALAQKYLGAPEWEKDLKLYVHGKNFYDAIPRPILYEYNAHDVLWTWRLYRYFYPVLVNDPRLGGLARHEFLMARFYQDVENNHIGVDLDYLAWLDTKVQAEWDEALQQIRDLTGDPKFNPNSWMQVKKWYLSHGVDKLKSTAEKVLADLVFNEGSVQQQFTDLVLECRGITKIHGTYIKGILTRQRDGLVYPTFKVFGTTTGRLSSSDPNVQNIPRDVGDKPSLRRIFVPRDREHRSFVECDYSQAELRVMACLSNDAYLISLFQPGMPDFFDSLLPVTYPNEDTSTWDKDLRKNNRAKLKGVIYGLSYGRMAKAIAKELKMSVREAQAIINNYAKAAPEFWDWREWVKATVLDPSTTLVSPFGRHFQAEVVTSGSRNSIVNSGLSFLPQSTASDLCVIAAMRVNERLKTGEFGDSMIVNTIHDAILCDVPDEFIEPVGHLMQAEMQKSGFEVFQQVPFATEFTFGKSWEGI